MTPMSYDSNSLQLGKPPIDWQGVSDMRNEGWDVCLQGFFIKCTKENMIEEAKLFSYSAPRNGSQVVQGVWFKLVDLMESNETLKCAVHNLIKMFRLSNEYVFLLQDAISPEAYDGVMDAYEKIALSYARSPRNLTAPEIARQSKIVLAAAGDELASDEIAEILNLDIMAVEKTLTQYSLEEA